jgi:hypothetical protein
MVRKQIPHSCRGISCSVAHSSILLEKHFFRRMLASDSPSDMEWQHAEQCRLLSMASVTAAILLGVRTVFTLPSFFCSVGSVASVLNPGLDGMG